MIRKTLIFAFISFSSITPSYSAEFDESDIQDLVSMTDGVADRLAGHTFEASATYRESNPHAIGSGIRLSFYASNGTIIYCDVQDLKILKEGLSEEAYKKALRWDWVGRTLSPETSGTVSGTIRLVWDTPSIILKNGCTFTPANYDDQVEEWQ